MGTRLDDRPRVPISAEQRGDLAALRDPSTPLGHLAAELLGGVPRSDSAVLALAVRLGLQQLRERAQEAGYAELAEQMATPEAAAERAALRAHRNRRAAAWASA